MDLLIPRFVFDRLIDPKWRENMTSLASFRTPGAYIDVAQSEWDLDRTMQFMRFTHFPVVYTLALLFPVYILLGPKGMQQRAPMNINGLVAMGNFAFSAFAALCFWKVAPMVLGNLEKEGLTGSMCACGDLFTDGVSGYWVWVAIMGKTAQYLFCLGHPVLRKRPVSVINWYHHTVMMVVSVYLFPSQTPLIGLPGLTCLMFDVLNFALMGFIELGLVPYTTFLRKVELAFYLYVGGLAMAVTLSLRDCDVKMNDTWKTLVISLLGYLQIGKKMYEDHQKSIGKEPKSDQVDQAIIYIVIFTIVAFFLFR